MDQPGFLTPVAEAQENGVTIYWLGEEFSADRLTFVINGSAELIHRNDGLGLALGYSADIGDGSVGFGLGSYRTEGGRLWRGAKKRWELPALRLRRPKLGRGPANSFPCRLGHGR